MNPDPKASKIGRRGVCGGCRRRHGTSVSESDTIVDSAETVYLRGGARSMGIHCDTKLSSGPRAVIAGQWREHLGEARDRGYEDDEEEEEEEEVSTCRR